MSGSVELKNIQPVMDSDGKDNQAFSNDQVHFLTSQSGCDFFHFLSVYACVCMCVCVCVFVFDYLCLSETVCLEEFSLQCL